MSTHPHSKHKSKSLKKPRRPPVSRLQVVTLCLLTALFLLVLAFAAIKPFRDEVDELYYRVYAKLYVDATLTELAVKQANIPYCGTDSRYQKLDLYLPKHSISASPIVLYVHGGGWTIGDKSNPLIANYGQAILQRGIAVASINYRLAPQAKYPIQNQDVACAVRYIRQHAAEYNLSASQIGLFGDSAGGQLVALTAFDPQFKGVIKAVVEFYGTSDLWAQLNRKPHADKRAIAYLGSASDRQLAAKASPVNVTVDDPPPFLLFHGINDQTVAYSQSVALATHVRAAGGEATVQPVRNANHNFSALSSPTAIQIRAATADFFALKLR